MKNIISILVLDDYRLPIVASFCLFLSMINYWISLAIPKNNFLFTSSKIFLLVSNLLLGITLLLRWIKESYFPLSNLYESLIFLTWAISSIQLIIEKKTKSRLIGSICTPILFFLSSFSSLTLPIEMQKALPLVPSLQSNWLMMHVSMMMISYATLIIGSLLSILYLAFTFRSKNKNEAKISLLETLDLWSYRIIGLGFPFLTIGIISGAVWANEAWGSYWSWDPKETWALITWLIFAIYLHSRILKGWEGKKVSIIGSCGFFSIWLCYLGVNFLAKGLHSYGWVMSLILKEI
jgi:cytochrome c-type biogenesis protein CcsB